MKSSFLVLVVALLLALWHQYERPGSSAGEARAAPEFPSQDAGRWINSVPLKMTGTGDNGLRGKVVLLNVWTFM
jgi:hypothetical protein